MFPTGIAAEKISNVAATRMSVLDNSIDTLFAVSVQSLVISSILFIGDSIPFASHEFNKGASTMKAQKVVPLFPSRRDTDDRDYQEAA